MDDPNPAATLFAATVAGAAAAVTHAPIASDEILTLEARSSLGGYTPEPSHELPRASAAAAPAFDTQDLIKIALLIVVASWIGSALLQGK